MKESAGAGACAGTGIYGYGFIQKVLLISAFIMNTGSMTCYFLVMNFLSNWLGFLWGLLKINMQQLKKERELSV